MNAPAKPPRRQCKKCPWKVGTNPREIPDGYSEVKHRALASTIAESGVVTFGPLRVFACHETAAPNQLPCVGWLHHQLGEGNNLALRMAARDGRVDANVITVGPQHRRLEDTLPRDHAEEWSDP